MKTANNKNDPFKKSLTQDLAQGFIASALWFARDEMGRSLDETNYRVDPSQIDALEQIFAQMLDEPELSDYLKHLGSFPLGGAYTAGTQFFYVAKGLMDNLFFVRREGLFWKRDVVVKLHELSGVVRASGLVAFCLNRQA